MPKRYRLHGINRSERLTCLQVSRHAHPLTRNGDLYLRIFENRRHAAATELPAGLETCVKKFCKEKFATQVAYAFQNWLILPQQNIHDEILDVEGITGMCTNRLTFWKKILAVPSFVVKAVASSKRSRETSCSKASWLCTWCCHLSFRHVMALHQDCSSR